MQNVYTRAIVQFYSTLLNTKSFPDGSEMRKHAYMPCLFLKQALKTFFKKSGCRGGLSKRQSLNFKTKSSQSQTQKTNDWLTMRVP